MSVKYIIIEALNGF